MKNPTIYLYDTNKFQNRFLVDFLGCSRLVDVGLSQDVDEFHRELGEQIMVALAEIAESEGEDLHTP